jgi:hypothetical protein
MIQTARNPPIRKKAARRQRADLKDQACVQGAGQTKAGGNPSRCEVGDNACRFIEHEQPGQLQG